jgi:L-amino acid N-acyltransferase YncA
MRSFLDTEERMDGTMDAMRAEDWHDVRAIYLEGLATRHASFEIDAPSWERWDAAHHAHSRLVYREAGHVIAWAALAPVSSRPCYGGVAEASLYVAAAARGRGVGRRLLEALIASSERHGIWMLQGATLPENTASLRLQAACGFRIVGRRERIARHHGHWRDTILTERRSGIVGADENL